MNAMVGGFAAALAREGNTTPGLAHALMAHYVGLRTLQRADVPADQFLAGIDSFKALIRP